MEATLKGLYAYRDLLYAWTVRTVRGRYQQSVLGGLWAILQPAATVAVLTIIFTRFLEIDTGGTPYVVFSYTAMVPWFLFSNSVGDMVEALVVNMNLVAKIYFPREVLVMASMFARLVDFVIAFSVLIVLMLYYRMPVFTTEWLYLPIILLIQLAFAFGLGLAGAAINVFYRDIRHLFALGLQLGLYATPIIYPITMVPSSFQTFYFMNPMAGVVQAYRAVLLQGEAPGPYLVQAAVVAFTVLLGGYFFFKRLEYRFADVV